MVFCSSRSKAKWTSPIPSIVSFGWGLRRTLTSEALRFKSLLPEEDFFGGLQERTRVFSRAVDEGVGGGETLFAFDPGRVEQDIFFESRLAGSVRFGQADSRGENCAATRFRARDLLARLCAIEHVCLGEMQKRISWASILVRRLRMSWQWVVGREGKENEGRRVCKAAEPPRAMKIMESADLDLIEELQFLDLEEREKRGGRQLAEGPFGGEEEGVFPSRTSISTMVSRLSCAVFCGPAELQVFNGRFVRPRGAPSDGRSRNWPARVKVFPS